MTPNSSLTRLRSEAIISSGELSKASDAVKWVAPPGVAELGNIAGQFFAPGCFCVGDFMDASAYERPQLYKLLSGGRPCQVHGMRELLDSRAPTAESEPKKSTGNEEVDMFAAAQARGRLCVLGDIRRPRQKAANLCPQAP